MSDRHLNVVLFTGGRGSGLLSRELVGHPRVHLTLVVNGYDDGKSTGKVRRLLGDFLGPSDFRKNASRLAAEMGSCPRELLELLDYRFPPACDEDAAARTFAGLAGRRRPQSTLESELGRKLDDLGHATRTTFIDCLKAFADELDASDGAFSFSDCSLGNLVFAGFFLLGGRDFNDAVAAYCHFVGLTPGLIENVTDGTNAHLVALASDGRVLTCEADIVDASTPARIRELFLLAEAPSADDRAWLESATSADALALLRSRCIELRPNERVLARLREADLIVYAPGTQHSSLFPSYLTPGVGEAIGNNLRARKLLITNLQEDAEIHDSNAVDIIDRAVYYLRERGRSSLPTPCLITHYLVNDPTGNGTEAPYLPLGPLDTLEDPRLVRIGDYEEGVSGQHNADKVVAPFVRSLLVDRQAPHVAILLLETTSVNKITQTALEALRGGLDQLSVRCVLFCNTPEPLDPRFSESLPLPLVNLFRSGEPAEEGFLRACREQEFDYVLLFESSGMYRGEDIVNLVSHLTWSRLDAVWGSRRLSLRDIRASYRFRYRHKPLLGTVSYIGSHFLSLAYLLLYGRYVSDTLSGVRAVRASYLQDRHLDLSSRVLNQRLLSRILGSGGDLFESPVRFLPISPKVVRRTTVRDGVAALLTMLRWRFAPAVERVEAASNPGRELPGT